MHIEQLYTGCLSEAAYYIESEGEVAIIDPLRETQPYIDKANGRGATIKYIFETHFHADFVSGHVDLAQQTGATIVYGPTAKTGYEIHEATDGEVFQLGKINFQVLHTPGHTPESSTFLLKDEAGNNHAIFTGDTLFIGDVGRPDLAIKGDLTKEDLAGLLYDSLRNKIMPLEDEVLVYPAHGAGSACGKNMSSETFSTLGAQKESNYALRDISKEQFIKEVTEGILPPPQYFPKNAMINKSGYESVDVVMDRGTKALSAVEVQVAAQEGALILDTRTNDDFRGGFIPGSLFIGLDGSFASWVGTLIQDLKRPIAIVANEGQQEEAVMRLARVGYDHAIGYLKGGVAAWKEAGFELDTLTSISAESLKKQLDSVQVLDVRKCSEYDAGHVTDAINYPLDFINNEKRELDEHTPYYLHCKSGYRSVIAASILKSRGFKNVVDVTGGFEAIEKVGIPIQENSVI